MSHRYSIRLSGSKPLPNSRRVQVRRTVESYRTFTDKETTSRRRVNKETVEANKILEQQRCGPPGGGEVVEHSREKKSTDGEGSVEWPTAAHITCRGHCGHRV